MINLYLYVINLYVYMFNYVYIFRECYICIHEHVNFNMIMFVSIDTRAINKMYQIYSDMMLCIILL